MWSRIIWIPLSFWSRKQTTNNHFVRFLCHRKRHRFTFTPVFLRPLQIDGYSLDAQKARMKAYADFNDYQIVGEYEDARAKKQAIEADKITGDNIYKVLICFEKLYNVMNPLERKKLMEHLISEIQIYPERQPNGQWLKSIKFRLPIVESDIDLCLDNESHTECVIALSKGEIDS